MVRRSFALAHEDVEMRKALLLHVEARILSNQPFFVSVLGISKKGKEELLSAKAWRNVRPLAVTK
jgi:hypothetical protein